MKPEGRLGGIKLRLPPRRRGRRLLAEFIIPVAIHHRRRPGMVLTPESGQVVRIERSWSSWRRGGRFGLGECRRGTCEYNCERQDNPQRTTSHSETPPESQIPDFNLNLNKSYTAGVPSRQDQFNFPWFFEIKCPVLCAFCRGWSGGELFHLTENLRIEVKIPAKFLIRNSQELHVTSIGPFALQS
jgi:hypothetical protein